MNPDTDLIVVALAGLSGLLVALASLIALRRVRRARSERRAFARRDGYDLLLADGEPAELEAVTRQACSSSRVRDDLVRCARRTLPDLPPDRASVLAAAATAGGLDRRVRKQLQARHAVTRGNAAVLASWVCRPPASVLEPLLQDTDGDVRLAAADALAMRQDADGAWALVGALRDETVDDDRIVERLVGPWALDVLLAACDQPDYVAVRPALAEALGLVGDPRALDALLALVTDGNDEERVHAARALGQIGSQGALDALTAALDDDFWAVRAQAARGLGLLGAATAIEGLVGRMGDRSWWVRANCAEALRAIGSDGIAALRTCADSHPDRYARQRAAEALAMEAALSGAIA